MTLDATIRAVQTKLGVSVDGNPGPQTWTAIHRAIVGEVPTPTGSTTLADERSERNIATLLPQVQPLARTLIARAAAAGIKIKIISGTRTYEQQDALYEQGRTRPGPVVTNARAGYSWHNFGIAFDVGVFEGERYMEDSPRYATLGAIGESLGLEWGGRWKFRDEPHFQLNTGLTLEQARERVRRG